MASTINSDNGVVSGSSGVKTTADTSGVLALQSNGSTGLTLGTDLSVTSVNYISGVGLRSLTAGGVRFYNAGNSNYSFITTPAGTGDMQFETGAGEQMRLTGTGLGVGTTAPLFKLQSNGTVARKYVTPGTTGSPAEEAGFVYADDSSTPVAGMWFFNEFSSGNPTQLAFKTRNSAGTVVERLRIGSSGQFGVAGANYGTSGQVLTSGGSGAAPSWATAGGAWTLLSTVTASGAATADVETTFDSTYDNYAIVATNILSSTNGANLWVRLKIGGTYQTALYSYGNYGITANSASGRFIAETSDAKIIINSVGGGEGGLINTASSPGMFTLYTQNPSNASTFKLISGQFAYVPGDGGTRFTMCNFGGRYHGAVGALTGIRFLASAGNITGTFRLYGIKNS